MNEPETGGQVQNCCEAG